MAFSIRQKGYLAITIAMIELSLLPILSSVGAKNIGTIPLLFYIFLIATVSSFFLVVYKKRIPKLKNLLTNKNSIVILAFAGILNYAGAQLFLTYGVLGTNPVVVSIILKLWPLMLAVMLPFTLRTKVEWQQAVALVMAFAGVYILLTNGTMISINLHELPFIAFVVLSTFCTAFSNIIIKSQNHDIYSEIFIFNLASFAVIVLIAPFLNAHLALNLSISSLIPIIFLGVITYSIGALLFFYTLKALNPLVAANASYSTPFMTIIFSYIILGTALKTYYLYALALILSALVIQNRYSKRAPKYRKTIKKNVGFLYDVTGAFVGSTHPQIYKYIKGNGRALAVKLETSLYSNLNPNQKQESYDCLVFTNRNVPESVKKEEIEFIENIISPQKNELIVIAIGKTVSAEKVLNEIISKAHTEITGTL